MLLLAATVTPAALGAQASTVVLVRHAEKADTTKDTGLSEAGMARAEALRSALAGFPLEGIFVSEYRRTAQTAAPTAEAHHLTPSAIPIRGDKATQAAETAAAIALMARGSAALVVGHSNTIGLLMAALGGPVLPELCDGEYATLFILERPEGQPPRLLRATFGIPDPPEAVACHDAEPGPVEAPGGG